MPEETEIDGYLYKSTGDLVVGDYGGAGSVGAANIRVLIETFPDYQTTSMSAIGAGYATSRAESIFEGEGEPGGPVKLVIAEGGHGSQQAWLLAGDPEVEEILEKLENYPLLDEETESEIVMEWEQEAWDSWVKMDLLDAIEDPEVESYARDRSEDELWVAYLQAMQETNTYPEPEYSGVAVDVEAIAPAFEHEMRRRMEGYPGRDYPRLPLTYPLAPEEPGIFEGD